MNQYKMQILQLVFHTVLLVREPTIEILDFGVNEKAFSVSFVAEYDIQGWNRRPLVTTMSLAIGRIHL